MRISRLQERMKESGYSLFVIDNPSNLFYLGKIPKDFAGRLLVSQTTSYYLTDARFLLASENLEVDQVIEEKRGNSLQLLALIKEHQGSIALDSGVPLDSYLLFQGVEGVRLQLDSSLEKMRQIKDSQEIELMRASAHLVEETFLWLQDKKLIGTTERHLAWQIEEHLRHALGADELAFPVLVGSGANGALPHAFPQNKKIAENELVVIDLGAILHGYCSDSTRTFFTGKLDRKENKKAKQIYQTVVRAQEAALDKVAPGVKAREVDRAARQVFRQAGLEKYFLHSTGHGLGIDVHEHPGIGPAAEITLQEGHVITVEPGLYIPQFGGVRIEDTVIVKESGLENLSPMSKDP